MHRDLAVSTCVTVREGCPITCHVNGDNQAEFSFGGVRDGFEFVFETEALRRLLMLGTDSLSKLTSRTARPASETRR